MNTFTIHPADRVSHIHEYYFSRKLREVARLNAEDADIVSLGIGGPDRAPDRSVIGTLAAEAGAPTPTATSPTPDCLSCASRWRSGTVAATTWSLTRSPRYCL